MSVLYDCIVYAFLERNKIYIILKPKLDLNTQNRYAYTFIVHAFVLFITQT